MASLFVIAGKILMNTPFPQGEGRDYVGLLRPIGTGLAS